MLIASGTNAPLTIVALTVVGVGDVGELFPHAITAVDNITAVKAILIRTDMINSFRSAHTQAACPIAAGRESHIGGSALLRLAYETRDVMTTTVSQPLGRLF
jgi:hypothetical protein